MFSSYWEILIHVFDVFILLSVVTHQTLHRCCLFLSLHQISSGWIHRILVIWFHHYASFSLQPNVCAGLCVLVEAVFHCVCECVEESECVCCMWDFVCAYVHMCMCVCVCGSVIVCVCMCVLAGMGQYFLIHVFKIWICIRNNFFFYIYIICI